MSDQQAAGYDAERVIADLGQQVGQLVAENARLRAALTALLAERAPGEDQQRAARDAQ